MRLKEAAEVHTCLTTNGSYGRFHVPATRNGSIVWWTGIGAREIN
jgi:hypothetical protein